MNNPDMPSAKEIEANIEEAQYYYDVLRPEILSRAKFKLMMFMDELPESEQEVLFEERIVNY